MNYYIQQSIVINNLKIESIANSSVFQIGTAGIIRGSSHLYNTGGFVEPAPEAEKPGQPQTTVQEGSFTMPAVPLVSG
ncbi:spore germination protein GerPB [Robertmurraya sp. Marseille-Q9965]